MRIRDYSEKRPYRVPTAVKRIEIWRCRVRERALRLASRVVLHISLRQFPHPFTDEHASKRSLTGVKKLLYNEL